jgi:glycosyltransferase involved in cell wall biosynthesis
MKILLIHAGANPKPGSTNAYIDSVAQGLSLIGHDVIELHTAIRKNSLRGFHQKEEVKKTLNGKESSVIQWINVGVYAGHPPGSGAGTADPLSNVVPVMKLRNAFRELLSRHRPDLVHLQNLFGFPVGLVEEIKALKIPLILTLQDYTPICPTSHLFLPEGAMCSLSRANLQCHQCCERTKTYSQFATEEFFNSLLSHLTVGSALWKLIAGIRNKMSSFLAQTRRTGKNISEYQLRYDAMLDLLRSADAVHCLSNLQAARIQHASGPINNLKVIPVSPPAVVHPAPISPSKSRHLLRFCVLNVQQGRNDKGYDYLLSALLNLESRRKDFHVDWYAEGVSTECIRFGGGYKLEQLDTIAASTDFSITPSLWLETQAYTGVEMLARGVPLVCSTRAGVSEWVVNGTTGILFDPSNPEEFVNLLESLITDRGKVTLMRDLTMKRATEIKTHQQHLREIAALYDEVVEFAKA